MKCFAQRVSTYKIEGCINPSRGINKIELINFAINLYCKFLPV